MPGYPPCGGCPVVISEKGECCCTGACEPLGSAQMCELYYGKLYECVNPALDSNIFEACVADFQVGYSIDPITDTLITNNADYAEILTWCHGLCGF
jgi:hypothetical protein